MTSAPCRPPMWLFAHQHCQAGHRTGRGTPRAREALCVQIKAWNSCQSDAARKAECPILSLLCGLQCPRPALCLSCAHGCDPHQLHWHLEGLLLGIGWAQQQPREQGGCPSSRIPHAQPVWGSRTCSQVTAVLPPPVGTEGCWTCSLITSGPRAPGLYPTHFRQVRSKGPSPSWDRRFWPPYPTTH